MPLQYADQTAALQLGHFAPKSAPGAHVTRLLVENETDPGLSSLRLSEAVRSAQVRRAPQGRRFLLSCAADGGARGRTENCGPATTTTTYDEKGKTVLVICYI
jgi:hypothetical protein